MRPTYEEICSHILSNKVVRVRLTDGSAYYLTEITNDQQKFLARFLSCPVASQVSVFYPEIVEIVEISDK